MTSASPHTSLAAGRWYHLSLAEQLGNAGSEVDRAIRAHAAGRMDRFNSALDRALELLDLTASDPSRTLPQRREILRAREQFCRLFFDPDAEPDLAEYLAKYFLQFATSARSKRPSMEAASQPDIAPPPNDQAQAELTRSSPAATGRS